MWGNVGNIRCHRLAEKSSQILLMFRLNETLDFYLRIVIFIIFALAIQAQIIPNIRRNNKLYHLRQK